MKQTSGSAVTQTETKPLIKAFSGDGRNVILAITGTSGAIYGLRMLRALLMNEYNVDLIMSEYAQYTLSNECNVEINKSNISSLFSDIVPQKASITLHNNLDLKSIIFTNEYVCSGMVVCPCAMGVLGGIANGGSSTLIEKSADHALSYSKPLIIVPRETPINKIHLKSMMKVMDAGACIVPAMPSFEYNPKDFNDLADFIAGKVMDLLCKDEKPLA